MPNVSVEVRVKPTQRNILEFSNNRIVVGSKTFTFTKVHSKSTQQQFFSGTVHSYVEKFISGENCSILAYGQTGSGKTYTMGLSAHNEKGVIQYALEWIFKSGAVLTCSFIEIYNENIYDLMSETRVPLNLRQKMDDISIVGQREVEIASYSDAISALQRGCENRTTKCTKMNNESSRSHAMFTIRLKKVAGNMITESKMSFVDLAGSERMKRTECSGNTARESISINSGLLSLGNVISALYLKKNHVPFRDSKLTRILEKCLNGYVLLIACVSGNQEDVFETTNTLKYASRAALINLNKKVQIENDKEKLVILNLRKEISALKDENNRLRATMITSGLKEERIKSHPLVNELLKRLRFYEGEEGIRKLLNEKTSRLNTPVAPNRLNTRVESPQLNTQIAQGQLNTQVAPSIDLNNLNLNNEFDKNLIEEPLRNVSKLQPKVEIFTKNQKATNPESRPDSKENEKQLNTEEIEKIELNAKSYETQPPINQREKKRARIVSFDLEPKKNILFTPLKELKRLRLELLDTIVAYGAVSLNFYNNNLLFNSVDSKIRLCNDDSSITVLLSDDSIRCLCSFGSLYYSSRSLLKAYSSNRPLPVYAYKSEISALRIMDSYVFTGHDDGFLNVLDLRTSKLLYTGRIHSSSIFDILLTQDGIYTCSRDHSVKYSKRCMKMEEQVLFEDFVSLSPPHYDSVSMLLYYKNACISLSRDCSIKAWKGAQPYKTVPYAHETWIRCGVSTETYFATGCKGGVVKLWDFVEGSIRCIGKIEVGSSINCMLASKSFLWIATQNKFIYKYSVL
ncbi:hypothetical protein GINT2_001487 [Glugoides intestinalis]